MTPTIETNMENQFKPAPVSKMPDLLCVGYVSQVLDAKISSTESGYCVQPFIIDGLESAPGTTRVQVLYHPEWLQPGFNPESLNDKGSQSFVYGQNISHEKKISTLRGLTGSLEAFQTLSPQLLGLSFDPTSETGTEDFMTEVNGVFHNFFDNNVESDGTPKKIGYVLRQKIDKDPITGERTKRTTNYEVTRWFEFTSDQVKREVNGANKNAYDRNTNPGGIKVTFEEGVPY